MLNFEEVDKGVATGLQEVIPARWIISRVYLLSHVRKSARHRAGDFSLSFCFDWFVGSRHLVINCGLLGNRIYWSCQRFMDKRLVVVREGISTPNAPYLR